MGKTKTRTRTIREQLHKTCLKCGRFLPATTEHFYKGSALLGLGSICRACIRPQREVTATADEATRQTAKECAKCRRMLPATRELSTMAQQMEMPLEEHDRLIAYVLGLSHALNIAFFTAIAESGEAAPRLARMSSTTFDAQLEVATRVAGDNPDLYDEIQSLNDYGQESLRALSVAVERLCRSVREHDPAAFTAMMRRGREYLLVRRAARETGA